jgi:hypothetical protein
MKLFFTFRKLNLEALYQSKVLKSSNGNPSKLLSKLGYFCVQDMKFKQPYAVDALEQEKQLEMADKRTSKEL